MIEGRVTTSLEAFAPLRLIGSAGRTIDCFALINTGFTGELDLPLEVIRSLGFGYHSEKTAVVGDGSSVSFAVYSGSVEWHGVRRSESPSGPILGMTLLSGNRLTLTADPGGEVLIEEVH